MIRILLPVFSFCLFALPTRAEYRPTHTDSGWVRLFNGKDLAGLYPYLEGSAKGQNPGNLVSVHDSMIHFYQGRKRANKDAGTGGVLSTELEFGYYRARVEYRAGEFVNDGWLTGDPWNSGMFFHANAGAPPFPQAIECQLRVHLNSNGNKPCSVAAGDCNQPWAGDFWILTGAQIINKDGMASQLGGCCQPAYGNHKPDYEIDGWNVMEVEVFGDSLFRSILNGHEVNRGTKATGLNANNQRVPLKKGRLQLELEGSEFLFRNWEIKLTNRDSLYAVWYKEGCLDPAYQEYSKDANLHIGTLCKTPAVTGLVKTLPQKKAEGKRKSRGFDFQGRLLRGPSALVPAIPAKRANSNLR
ncbi:MAG: DUF1080 domain-containing protein [Fibrobacteria bacterium]